MVSLAPIIQQIVVSRMAGNNSAPRLIAREIAASAISLVLICVGLVFALYAEYVWLKTTMAAEDSALMTAGSAFLLAIAFALVARSTGIRKPAPQQSVPDAADITRMFSEIIDSIGGELEDPIRENPKTAIMLASLAGFIAGEQRH